MPKIKQLSSHEAQKIAAGEVVERPANIVKELVENSIDAGATRISIYIKDSGKQLIRIVDNGCGMDTADAQICFDRHATSKITSVNELETIETFGFRGEALASIASVSTITLITKEENSLEGTQITLHAGTSKQIKPIACVTGTDISVHELFFNVPARKKFLKTTQTEWRAIQLLFDAFCFAYPHIHFLLFSDDKQVHNCPATTTVKNRSLQLLPQSTHEHLIELQSNNSGHEFSLTGIISDHQQYRYDRSNIYFFVNKRWVKNQHLSSALIKGYANVIAAGRYPLAALHITIPAHEIDINIHPRKEEVKFLHPRRVEQALQEAVKSTLEKNLSQQLKKEVTFSPFTFFDQHQPRFEQTPFTMPFVATVNKLGTNQTETISSSHIHSTFDSSFNEHQIKIDAQSPCDTNPENDQSTESYQLIGQYKKTYLLIEKEEGLFLVDQHAAHERILYELFSQKFNEVATIQLLFPQTIQISPQEIDLITPHLDIFTSNGIIIEQCASNQLIVQSLPVHLKNQSLHDIIQETISWITQYAGLENQELKKTINNKLQAQMACKAAVKAGDTLTQQEMEKLLHDLEKTANRFSCPHGRPTGWLLSLNEIEKKFKRRL